MQKLLLIRFGIRFLLMPLVSMGLTVYLAISHTFEVWQLPLLIAMLGTPLLAGGDKDPE